MIYKNPYISVFLITRMEMSLGITTATLWLTTSLWVVKLSSTLTFTARIPEGREWDCGREPELSVMMALVLGGVHLH